MPFLWKSTSRVPDQKYQLCGETSLLAASALCPVGVAHVSRLIGKFDTTENRSGWQVGFAETFSLYFSNLSKRTKRHSQRSGVFMPCTGHWPPKSFEGGGYFHRAFYRLFRPVSL
jgi:hypothetical protein